MAMDERVPVAVWEGTFHLFGVKLRCVVLDDGRRVVNAEDVARLFATIGDEEREYPPGDIAAFARWRAGE